MDTFCYYIEHLVDNCMLPGQIENWIIIQNLNDFGITSLPLAVITNGHIVL